MWPYYTRISQSYVAIKVQRTKAHFTLHFEDFQKISVKSKVVNASSEVALNASWPPGLYFI